LHLYEIPSEPGDERLVAENSFKSDESRARRGLDIQEDPDRKEIIREEGDGPSDDVAANPARQCAQFPLTAGNRRRGIASRWKSGVYHRGSDYSDSIGISANLALERACKECEATDELGAEFDSLNSTLNDRTGRLRRGCCRRRKEN
jgi:hypothetical protein